jgi:hypothetical protein
METSCFDNRNVQEAFQKLVEGKGVGVNKRDFQSKIWKFVGRGLFKRRKEKDSLRAKRTEQQKRHCY